MHLHQNHERWTPGISLTTCHVTVSMVLSNQRAASYGAEIQVHARLTLQIAILPLLFDISPLSVSNEELIPGICPLSIRNLPAWYQEFARCFFRDMAAG